MPDAIDNAIPAPSASEVVCPKCGDQALAYFPLTFLDIPREECDSRERYYRDRGHDILINTDHNGRVILWFYPDLFDTWPDGVRGWPASLTVCVCRHCGHQEKHRYSVASLNEQWGLGAELKVSFCPICGDGPWPESYTVQEVAYSYWICEGCNCEYGYDDTPEFREEWLVGARDKLTPAELDERMCHMIMNWNRPQQQMWTYRRPAPIDLEDGYYLI